MCLPHLAIDENMILKNDNLPSSPCFSPHLGFVSFVWREIITIETIAGVNLLEPKQYT